MVFMPTGLTAIFRCTLEYLMMSKAIKIQSFLFNDFQTFHSTSVCNDIKDGLSMNP